MTLIWPTPLMSQRFSTLMCSFSITTVLPLPWATEAPFSSKPNGASDKYSFYCLLSLDKCTSKKATASFLESTDWDKVDSNLERLPYLAWQLERNTPKLRETPQPDDVLFSFASKPQWKEKLPRASLILVDGIIREYESCLTRVRISLAPIREQPHRTDVERILFSRGQEELYEANVGTATELLMMSSHFSI